MSYEMETQEVEGKVVLVKSEVMSDWWCIERAEHDGREWLEEADGYSTFMRSARISDADVEGTAEEMVEIARAIRQRGSYSAKRCAVDARGERVLFWSPRNSRVTASISREAAEDLATQIEAGQ